MPKNVTLAVLGLVSSSSVILAI